MVKMYVHSVGGMVFPLPNVDRVILDQGPPGIYLTPCSGTCHLAPHDGVQVAALCHRRHDSRFINLFCFIDAGNRKQPKRPNSGCTRPYTANPKFLAPLY